jgi:NADH-quinone oxidoreductase subunit E
VPQGSSQGLERLRPIRMLLNQNLRGGNTCGLSSRRPEEDRLMSVRRLAADQPEGFAFSPENLAWAEATLKKYPEGKQASGVIPLLWRAQEQMGGWLPEPALRYIADMLGMAYIRVYEIATFYTMFNLAPVGKYYVQLCGTTPCWLRGAEELKQTCLRVIGEPGHVTADGMLSWTEVECLGACCNAPMVQINKDYYEDVDGERLAWILENLRAGREVVPGPQNGRHSSEPKSGATTLTSDGIYKDGGAANQNQPLTDRNAKRPTDAASRQESAVPQPPVTDAEGESAAKEAKATAKKASQKKSEKSGKDGSD